MWVGPKSQKNPVDNWKIDLMSRSATVDIFFNAGTEGVNSNITKGIIEA
jgi:hypothetical protein